MAEFFGSTPPGIILLDVILALMGCILTPLLFGIFKRLGDLTKKDDTIILHLTDVLSDMAQVVTEANDEKVRDMEINGRLKGMDNHLIEIKNLLMQNTRA